MSWSCTINKLTPDTELPHDLVEKMTTQHILYPHDMFIALKAAKRAGFSSCTITGARTPSPLPGGDEVVDISIRGFMKATDYREEIKRILRTGPDSE
jgi:hypothetical protein